MKIIRGVIFGLIFGFAITMAVQANLQEPVKQNAPYAYLLEQPKAEKFKVVFKKVEAKPLYSLEDLHCLAKNIFHEAGVESEKGKLAVAQVTLNRVDAGRWGNSICEVVYAKAQFSWTLQKEKVKEKPKGPLWKASLAMARAVLEGQRDDTLSDALFYYNPDKVNRTPNWASEKYRIAKVDSHIFFTQDLKRGM